MGQRSQELGRQKWAPMLPWDLNGQKRSHSQGTLNTHREREREATQDDQAAIPPIPTPSCPTLPLSCSLSWSSFHTPALFFLMSKNSWHKNSSLPHCFPPPLAPYSGPVIVYPLPPPLCKGKELMWVWTLLMGRLNTGMPLGPFVFSLFHQSKVLWFICLSTVLSKK